MNCVICGEPAEKGCPLCPDCLAKKNIEADEHCDYCGQPTDFNVSMCPDCQALHDQI
jgi:predicted amidophosphoribosyltransferase